MFQIPSIKWNKVSLSKVTVSSIFKNQLFKLQFQTFWKFDVDVTDHLLSINIKVRRQNERPVTELTYLTWYFGHKVGQTHRVESIRSFRERNQNWTDLKVSDDLPLNPFGRWHLSTSPPRGHPEVIQRSFIVVFYLESTEIILWVHFWWNKTNFRLFLDFIPEKVLCLHANKISYV